RKAPANLTELQSLVASTKGTIRPVGAGHSFSALVPTDGTIISLSRLAGLDSHNKELMQATLWGGTRLGDIGEPLEAAGQAMINMPDIDEQTLAGCIATATHGTGAGIGCLSTFVRALELVDARGDLHECDAQNNPELFQAALVSLGTVGIISRITLQNIAPYRLREEMVWRDFDEILNTAESLADKHRNFEFYYFPFTGMGVTHVHDFTDEPIGSTDQIDGNDGVEDLKRVRDLLQWAPKLRELLLGGYLKTLDDEISIDSSWKNYASERNVRFNEMEYHLPRENGLQALREIREALEENHPEVFFPIEFRFINSDDIWLSPFFGRDTCSIAVHRYFDEDFTPYFRTIEPIFSAYTRTGMTSTGCAGRWIRRVASSIPI
ncbi:MAG: FAD-linked oxidoreductase, partial [Bacteroidia bacterium]